MEPTFLPASLSLLVGENSLVNKPGAMLCKLPANHVRQRKTEPKKCLLGSTALPLMVSPKRTNHGTLVLVC